MSLKSIGIGAVCFAIGGMAGMFITSDSESAGDIEKGPTSGNSIPGTKDKPRHGINWNDSLSNSHKTNRPDSKLTGDSMISVPISLLESLSLAKSTRTFGQPIIDGNDPVEAALGLTSVEKDRIQADWQKACDSVREIEVKSMATKDLEDGSVQISLPNLSKERREVAEKFLNKLSETLGPERGDAFYATKQVSNMFAQNSGERAIAVKIESVGKDEWSYTMTLEDASGSRVWVGESIPLEIRHLADAAGIFPTVKEAVKVDPK